MLHLHSNIRKCLKVAEPTVVVAFAVAFVVAFVAAMLALIDAMLIEVLSVAAYKYLAKQQLVGMVLIDKWDSL